MPRTRSAEPKRRRRARGEGSIFKKTRKWTTQDGKIRSKVYWCLAVSQGREDAADGGTRRKRTTLYFTTAAEAIAARVRYFGEQQGAPEVVDVDPTTLSQFVEHFLAEWKKRPTLQGKAHSPATLDSYRITLRKHVEPHIGDLPVAAIDAHVIESLYRKLESKVSPSMRARVHSALRVLFSLAVEERIVAVNPTSQISRGRVPRHQRPHIAAFEPDEVAALLKAAKGDRLGAIVQVAVDSGARQGELFALRWQDIDLERGVIFICRSASETSAGLSLADVKTRGSRRNVSITRDTITQIRKRYELAAREGFDARTDLIFPSERGHVLRKSNFLREFWNPVRNAADLPTARFHSLRHTCATLLLRAGVHPKIVQERLGHASITLTMDTYSDSIPSLQEHAAEAMAKALHAIAGQKPKR